MTLIYRYFLCLCINIKLYINVWHTYSCSSCDSLYQSYCQISIKLHQIPKLQFFSSHLAVVFALSIEARCELENEDIFGAAPPGDAPTTSEWSTIWLPIKVQLVLEIWQHLVYRPVVHLGHALWETLSPGLCKINLSAMLINFWQGQSWKKKYLQI